ncbi:MAG: hypothetical protein HKP40_02935 [Litoreibacter sp.]|nr:hypothetical protein [Litoreibacter sp.]
MMPDGWTSIPFPGGPLKGANALLVFIDRALQLDPEGKPADPANMRAVAVVGLGKQEGGDAVRLYVFRIYTTDAAPDPYKNAVASDIARSTSVSGPANAGRMRKEEWTIAPDGGGAMSLSLDFTSGKRGWSSDEARPFSNTDPEFSRIYRYNQLVDLVMSAPVGKPMGGNFEFSSTIPEMSKIFDGTQELVAILDVPVYVREVYLP